MKTFLMIATYLLVNFTRLNADVPTPDLPSIGILTGYSLEIDWSKGEYLVDISVTFPYGQETRKNSIEFTFDIQETSNFSPDIESPVVILSETMSDIVGQSIFQFQFGNDTKVYTGIGPSIYLTPADWGLNETRFMVTDVDLPYITLNGENRIKINSATNEILGKVFHSIPEEEFIVSEPGLSTFTYLSEDKKSSFQQIAPSINSHWTPSEEQMANVAVVKYIGYIRTYHIFRAIVLSGCNSTYTLPASLGSKAACGKILFLGDLPDPTWTKEGNRWVIIKQGVYVDLDSGVVIQDVKPSRTIQITW